MFQTFNENQYMLQSKLLRHGELAWLARSTYFGDQRNYLETHVDDNFLGDASWSVREAEGLSIAQIADRLGRSAATVKAYFYDSSDANKGPSWEREAEAGDRELPESPARRGTKSGNPSPTDLFCAGLAVQHVR